MHTSICLPKDLKGFIRHVVIKRIIFCIVLLICFSLFLAFFGDTVFGEQFNLFKIICYIVIIIAPFIISGVPLKLIDRTYLGKVVNVDQVLTLDNERNAKPSRESSFTRNTIYLTVVTPDDKTIRRKAYSGMVKLQQHLDTYKNGDEVFHLAYSPLTVVLPKSSDTRVQCCLCGTSNDLANNNCHHCQHTLVKKIGDM